MRAETHERNVLMWLAARPRRAGRLLILLVLASLCLGCGVDVGPTSPSDMSPEELRMLGYLQCYAEAKGLRGEVSLVLFDHERRTDERSQLPGSVIICQTWPRDDGRAGSVECWRPWINGETQYPSGPSEKLWAAGHEICHMTGIWDEAKTNACNVELHESGVCSV